MGTALSSTRIEQLANREVRLGYTEGKTGTHKPASLALASLIGRFLAQVLPKAAVRLRCYGLLQPSQRHLLTQPRSLVPVRQAAAERAAVLRAAELLVSVPALDDWRYCRQPVQLVQRQPPKRQQQVSMVGEVSRPGRPDPKGEQLARYQLSRSAERAWLMECQSGAPSSAPGWSELRSGDTGQCAVARIRIPARCCVAPGTELRRDSGWSTPHTSGAARSVQQTKD